MNAHHLKPKKLISMSMPMPCHAHVHYAHQIKSTPHLPDMYIHTYVRTPQPPTDLVINRPSMLARWTFIKYSLPFIHRSHLNRIKSHFRSITFDTIFFYSSPTRLLGCPESLLLFITFCPQWHRCVG